MSAGESSHQNNLKEGIMEDHHHHHQNDYSLGFGNNHGDENNNGEHFLDDDGNIVDHDFSSSPNFDEVFEKIEVSHGMLISTRQTANTFYHQLVPSKTLRVHLHPIHHQDFTITKSDSRKVPNNSNYRHVTNKVTTILIAIIASMMAVLNAYWICYGECLTEKQCFKDDDETIEDEFSSKKIMGSVALVAGGGGGSISRMVQNKMWTYLTLSLALCTFWVHHAVPSS